MGDQNATAPTDDLDAFQLWAEARGLAKKVWNGELTFTLYVQNGETANREQNTKIKSRPPPKLAALATK